MHKDFNKQTCRQQSDRFIYSTPALSVLLCNSTLLKRYVKKRLRCKEPSIFSFCLLPKEPEEPGRRTQLNAMHAQLLEKLRPIAFAETCRFLTIHSLEFQQIWQKIVLRPRK